MHALLALVATAAAAKPSSSATYSNMFLGLGYAQGEDQEAYGMIRLFAVGAPQGSFVRGFDLDVIGTDDDDDYGEATGRLYLGAGRWVSRDLRVAAYSGFGLQLSDRPYRDRIGGDPRVALTVPVHAEVGWMAAPIALHVRGGLNVMPMRWLWEDGFAFTRTTAALGWETTLSAAVGGQENNDAVTGFRIEAGYVGGLWSVTLGWGG